MSEYPASHNHPRTSKALDELRDAGCLHDYKAEDRIPVTVCRTPGQRTDILRMAQKAADNTGMVQMISYGFTVLVQTNDDDADPTYEQTRHTWVLPDLTRRRAFLART